MPDETYEFLLQSLSATMAGMPAASARQLAAGLTSHINAKLAGIDRPLGPGMDSILPDQIISAAILTLPWAAFRAVHGQGLSVNSDSIQVVCSVPAELDAAVAGCFAQTRIWSGSLLAGIAQVIRDSRSEVILMSPYWSVAGARAILQRVDRNDFTSITAKLLTQPKDSLKKTEMAGLQYFSEGLIRKGASVRVLSPRRGELRTPLLHAKVVVGDGRVAYIGSGNISESGMDQSVELGVILSGPSVNRLRDWLDALIGQLVSWDS